MEPIQPDYPWQHCQYGDALPHAELLSAIVAQAWRDANMRIKFKPKDKAAPTAKDKAITIFKAISRIRARSWFYSYQFNEFCELLDINRETFLHYAKHKWGKL